MPALPHNFDPRARLARGRLYDRRTLSLHLTDLCNSACVFCAADTAAGRVENVAFADLVKILDANPSRDWPTVNLHGGEPTARPDFLDLLRLIRDRGYRRVILQTNSVRMASESFARSVLDAGIDVFVSGFHAADAETSRRITRHPHAFELAQRGFAHIKAAGAILRVTTVVCSENYTSLGRIAKLCASLRVDHVNFSALQPQSFASQSLVDYATARPFLEEAITIALEAGLVVTLEGMPYCASPGRETLHVDWSTQTLKVTYHDLVIDDFHEFLNATTRVRAEPCRRCALRAQCGGIYRDYAAAMGMAALEPYVPGKAPCA